jgi:hypothetical protein
VESLRAGCCCYCCGNNLSSLGRGENPSHRARINFAATFLLSPFFSLRASEIWRAHTCTNTQKSFFMSETFNCGNHLQHILHLCGHHALPLSPQLASSARSLHLSPITILDLSVYLTRQTRAIFSRLAVVIHSSHTFERDESEKISH